MHGYVISSLCGGLGNQMFQYALGHALYLRYEVPLLLDLSWFASMDKDRTPRRFHLDTFPALQRERGVWQEVTRAEAEVLLQPPLWKRVAAKVLRRPHWGQARCVGEQPGLLTPEASFAPPVYVHGYWQDERYFLSAATTIRQDFSFPQFPPPAATLAASLDALPDSIAVHIRRGDYVASRETNATHGTCSSEYYAEALKCIQQKAPKAHCFLFSDDPAWVREHFDTQRLPATVVDLHGEQEAHHDMHLMSLCKHHIIANSSFSWWGAWLAQPGGMTIAPKQWFADPAMADYDPCPERWMRM